MPEGDADTVIVGAGVGGLSAALALAAAGRRVVVVEALPEPGGKLGRFVTSDGIEVDTGPSVLTLPSVLAGVLARAGRRLQDELAVHRLDLATRYRFPDGCAFDTYGDLDKTLASVEAALGSAAAGELSRFLSYSRRIWEEAAPRFVLAPARSALSLLGMSLTAPRRALSMDPLRTLAQSVDAQVSEPHLRDLLLRFATYNGSDARRCPAPLASIAWVELGLGVFGVGGGLYEIARALERVGRELGVEYRYEARVSRVLVEDGRARGVALERGGALRAPAVLCNADVRHVMERLLPGRRRRRSPAPSMSAWTGVLRARRRPERAPHEVLFPAVYEREMAALFDEQRPPDEPTVYLCAQERAHARTGWQSHEPLFVMANAPAGVEGRAEALRERALSRLKHANLIDDGDDLVWQRTPADLAALFPDTLGALYGAASSTRSAAFFRPNNRAPSLAGLYFASGSVHPGGGVPLCLTSGVLAAEAILEDETRARSVA